MLDWDLIAEDESGASLRPGPVHRRSMNDNEAVPLERPPGESSPAQFMTLGGTPVVTCPPWPWVEGFRERG